MTSHTAISPQEAADGLAIRELVDAYAHCADGRDATAGNRAFGAAAVLCHRVSGTGRR